MRTTTRTDAASAVTVTSLALTFSSVASEVAKASSSNDSTDPDTTMVDWSIRVCVCGGGHSWLGPQSVGVRQIDQVFHDEVRVQV